MKKEEDPNNKDPHESGAKLDAGKNRVGLVLGGFPNALLEVSKVGTGGAIKYSDNGWKTVPNGFDRYTDAMLRHHFKFEAGEFNDQDTGLSHLAHRAWNALATLELHLLASQAKVPIQEPFPGPFQGNLLRQPVGLLTPEEEVALREQFSG